GRDRRPATRRRARRRSPGPRPGSAARAAAPCRLRTCAAAPAPGRSRRPAAALRPGPGAATARGDGARAPGPVSSGVELASSWISVPDAAPFGAEVHAAVQSWVAGHVPDDTAEAHPVVVDPAPAPAAVVGTIQPRLAADLAMHEQHRRVAILRRPAQADRVRVVHA